MLFLSLQTWADNLLAGTYHLLVDGLARIFYGFVWAVMYAFSVIITIIETGFYLFAGINTIGYRDSEGNQRVGYIIDAFLGNAKIFSAYLQLAIIAFVVMLILAVLKIIKQDYIDKAGPRSKGPIFRNLVVSFILYISIPPLFMILTSVSSILALSVYKAFGGGTDLIADILLKNSFGWKTTAINNNIAPYDVLYAGEQSFMNITGSNLFYSQYYLPKYGNFQGHEGYTYLREKSLESWVLPNGELGYGQGELIEVNTAENVTFYWYTYFIGAFVIVSMLFNMIMAMIGRVYKIVVLYVVAPVSIAQIVADDGAKFKKWQSSTISEFLKVVSSIITFMVFVIMIGAINSLDFTSIYAGGETAGLINEGTATIIGGSGITQNLSLFMATSGTSMFSSTMLNIFNATMKIFFILAGAQVIKEIDPLVTELVTGASGTSTSDQAVTGAMKNTAKLGALAAGAAIGVAGKGVGKIASIAANRTESKDQDKERASKIDEEAEKEINKNNGKDAAKSPDDNKAESPVTPRGEADDVAKDTEENDGLTVPDPAAGRESGGETAADDSDRAENISNDDKAAEATEGDIPLEKEPKVRDTSTISGMVGAGIDKIKGGVDSLRAKGAEKKLAREMKREAKKTKRIERRAEINRINEEKGRGAFGKTMAATGRGLYAGVKGLGKGALAIGKLGLKTVDKVAGVAVRGTAWGLKKTGRILQRGAVAALSITPIGKSALKDFQSASEKNNKHKQKLREAKEAELTRAKVNQKTFPAVAQKMKEKEAESAKAVEVADKNLHEAETNYKKASQNREISENELASLQAGLIDLEREETSTLMDVKNATNKKELIQDEARKLEDEHDANLINDDVYAKKKQSVDSRLNSAEEDIKVRKDRYESIKKRRSEELANISKKQKEVENYKKNEINAEKRFNEKKVEREKIQKHHDEIVKGREKAEANLASLKKTEGAKGAKK